MPILRPSANEPAPLMTNDSGPLVGDLVLVAGEGFFSTYPIAARALTIGRAPDCEICIDDKALSRRHAVIRELGVRHLAFAQRADDAAATLPDVAPPPAAILDDAQRDDRARVIAALEACAGNQTRAAARLGISRTTLVTKIRVYGIARPRV